jgi:chromatin remodeling complex protein RSC6
MSDDERVEEDANDARVSDEDESSERVRKPRERITKDSVTQEVSDLLEMIDTEIERSMKSMEKKKCVKMLRRLRKRIVVVHRHVPKIKRPFVAHAGGGGFDKAVTISDELAAFLHLHEKIASRADVQRALSAYIHLDPEEEREEILKWRHLNEDDRDLRDPEDRRIIIPDKRMRKLLHYREYQSAVAEGEITINRKGERVVVEDDRLRYWVIMKLVQRHFAK